MMRILITLMTILLFLSTVGTATEAGSVLSIEQRQMKFGLTWEDAQQYCREKNLDLATIYNQAHADSLNLTEYNAWIGLKKSANQWEWINGGDYQIKWDPNQENDNNENCAVISYNKKMIYSRHCETKSFAACQNSNNGSITMIQQMMTWSDAEEHCEDINQKLATFTQDEMTLFSEQDFPIWIGLHRNDNSWKWSSGLKEDERWNLDSNGNKKCVTITSITKKLVAEDCQTLHPSFCTDNVTLVKQNKSWEEALEYCLSLGANSNLSFNLLSLKPGENPKYMDNRMKEADTEEVWTGLRFLGDEWLWTDRKAMLFPGLLNCPPKGQRCGAILKGNSNILLARDCLERKNFLCYSY